MKYKLDTLSKKLLADTLTPVNIYLKLRDVYAGSILLESSDYHGHENSLSFICCDPLASFEAKGQSIEIRYPNNKKELLNASTRGETLSKLEEFKNAFDASKSVQSKYVNCGLFGYISYDAVRFFEDVQIEKSQDMIPDIIYKLYRYVIVVDHF
jgi:anthranilate synthase component 1